SYFGWTLADLRDRASLLEQNVEQKKSDAQKMQKAVDLLNQWQRRALPKDPEIARSLYQHWLAGLADRNLQNTKLTFLERQPSRRKVYSLFAFNIQSEATLEQLTKFLHEFYSAGHLHRIRFVNIQPVEKSSKLDLQITVEALSLPGSMQTDALSSEPGKRLKLPSWDDYKKDIVDRNVFAAYKPNPANNEPQQKESDPGPAKSTFLTAITEANGVRQAWLYVQPTGETLKIPEQGDFTLGPTTGKIVRIGDGEIVVEINGNRRTIGPGEPLIK
ncbi:MAG: hypothetical protein ACWGMZ_06380, partial [Thermoguttaceae bacterium]